MNFTTISRIKVTYAAAIRYPISGVKSTGSWNLICILYTQGVRAYTFHAYIYVSFSGQIFARRACIYSPVYSASLTAYNRINAAIRASLQCNSLALQPSKVFTPSCLCFSFTFRISFSPAPVRDENLLSENLHLTLCRATRSALRENYCEHRALLSQYRLFDVPFKLHLTSIAFHSRFCAFVCTFIAVKYLHLRRAVLKQNYSNSIISFEISRATRNNFHWKVGC